MALPIAIVTGASSGLGKQIYNQLKWISLYRYRLYDFDDVLGVSRHGPDIECDLPDTKILQKIKKDVVLLINCAGIMPFEESERVMDVNFWGTYNTIKTLRGNFTDGACIINFASISGINHDPDLPIYSASKAAVISLTKSLARSLAPKIRVNCISPGFFKTNLVEGDTPEDLIKTIPMGFEEEPVGIYPVVEMILGSPYMTGSNIVIDGGITC